MTITAKCLINSKFASSTINTEYTSPASTRTIIDKFTATNTTGSSVIVSIHIVPSGQTISSNSYCLISNYSIAANTAHDFTELKNQILEAGDYIKIVADTTDAVSIRMSGRQVS